MFRPYVSIIQKLPFVLKRTVRQHPRHASLLTWKQRAEDIFPLLNTFSLVYTGQTFNHLPKWGLVPNSHWCNDSNTHMLGSLKEVECSWPPFPAVKQLLHFHRPAETPCSHVSHFCPSYLVLQFEVMEESSIQVPTTKRKNAPDPRLTYIELHRFISDEHLTHIRSQSPVYVLQKNYTNSCFVSMVMSSRYFKNKNNFFIR